MIWLEKPEPGGHSEYAVGHATLAHAANCAPERVVLQRGVDDVRMRPMLARSPIPHESGPATVRSPTATTLPSRPVMAARSDQTD